MLSFERSGLSRKLTIISALSTGCALLLAFAAFATTHIVSHLDQERRQLFTMNGALAASSDMALLYVDPALGKQALEQAVLDGRDDIRQVALFDRDGKLLVRHIIQAGELAAPPDLAPRKLVELGKAGAHDYTGPFWAPGLRVYRAVHFQQDQVGAVMIEAGLPRMWLGVLGNLFAGAVAAALSFIVALVLARRFRDSIAEPIASLIAAAQQTAGGQPGARLQHRRSDELGTLIDSFNDMLTQIGNRDAKLAQYRDQLERQVGVRTEQLEKAKNAAESASQAKSAFLATMSHEIRTPMNGVLGMTELLLETEMSEQQHHYTSMVKRSGEHLLVIINDILDFSKIEAGKLTVEYIHFNFRELLDDIDHVFSPQAQAKQIALEFDVAYDIPVAICGDPNRLRQVMFNLLGNAIKFTESGQITVRVLVLAEDAQTVSLRFEVHDTGIGVSREARTHIFDSFSQADGSTTRKHGGTGLGLAISKQLVELMGGKIGVDNAQTQGSIFWFAVQFDKRRVDADDAAFNPTITQGMRALIVDHHQDSRASLERQLAHWALRSDSAAAPDEALRLLQQAAAAGQPYDVALLDMDLPLGGGLLLAAEIKADPAIAGVRLLLLSSVRGAADTVQRREAGVAFQLIKPARACDLYDCIVTPVRASEGVRTATLQPPRASRPRQRRRVLLAEDNPVNVEVASAMLEGLGLEVQRAANGAEALDAVRAEEFDLVLMDCQMPVMDGMAATAEIRRLEQQQGRRHVLPIMAITANALQGDREACLAAGMDDYLSKPFTQQALGQALARWIKLPPPGTPMQPPGTRRIPPRTAPCGVPTVAAMQAISAMSGMPAKSTAPATPATPAIPATPAVSAAPTPAMATTAAIATARAAPAAPPASALTGAAINRHALDNILALSPGKGAALLERVLLAYMDDTPLHFDSLRQAISKLNAGGIRKAAHSLKSSSANVGADALAQLCKEMEQLGRADTTEGAAGILTDMEREFQAVRQSLSAILEKET
ncbi:MAG: response regulator [Pseudomonadota bacterium]